MCTSIVTVLTPRAVTCLAIRPSCQAFNLPGCQFQSFSPSLGVSTHHSQRLTALKLNGIFFKSTQSFPPRTLKNSQEGLCLSIPLKWFTLVHPILLHNMGRETMGWGTLTQTHATTLISLATMFNILSFKLFKLPTLLLMTPSCRLWKSLTQNPGELPLVHHDTLP